MAVIRSYAEELCIRKIQEKGNQIIFTYDNGGPKPVAIYKRAGIEVLEDIAGFLEMFLKKNIMT